MSGFFDLSGTNNLRINYSNSVENILCTPNSTIFLNELDLSGGITVGGPLSNTFQYTSDMIGYTFLSSGTGSTPAPQSGTIYTVSSATLKPGIYINYLFTNTVTTNATTNISEASVGLSTVTATFTGGTGKIITLSNTVCKSSAAITGRICAKTLITMSVPTELIYYFVAQFNTNPQPTWDRSFSYWICTRIA